MSDPEVHRYNDLGRRIVAAIVSYHMGLRSLDYTLREYTPELVDEYWCDLGKQLLRLYQEHKMATLFGSQKPYLVVNNSNKDTK